MAALELPDSLSAESVEVFNTLLGAPSPSTEDLRAIVERYAAKGSGALHDALYANSRALLDVLEAGTDPESHARIQAAIRYLVIEDDGNHDAGKDHGLDDDAAIFNAVATAIGKSELCVEIPEQK